MIDHACAGLVERLDPDRFRAIMASPVPMRGPLFTLCAFACEIARLPWVSPEPLIAEMRLQWWRDRVVEEAQAEGAFHEVMVPLGRLMRSKNLSQTALDAMIAARSWDIYTDPHMDEAALEEYLDATSGVLIWLCAQALGAGSRQEPYARALGRAMGLARYLQAVPALAAHGKTPLADDRPQAVAALAQRGLALLAQAQKGALPRGAVMPAYGTRPLLHKIAKNPLCVAAGQAQLSEFTARRRLLWLAMTGRF